MHETDDDFIPTSTWEDLLVSRGYPQEVIDGMKEKRRLKQERSLELSD